MAPFGYWPRTLDTSNFDSIISEAQVIYVLIRHILDVWGDAIKVGTEWIVCHFGMIDGAQIFFLDLFGRKAVDNDSQNGKWYITLPLTQECPPVEDWSHRFHPLEVYHLLPHPPDHLPLLKCQIASCPPRSLS